MCGVSLNSHPNGFSCLRLVGIYSSALSDSGWYYGLLYSYSPFVDNDKMQSMAKTIESEPEQFKHQNSVLLYPNTEDHKNQAFRYLKQYIILCYDVTFLNFSMPQKTVCSVQTFFLCEHLVYKTRIYFRQEWLVYVMRMHSMWYVIFIKEIIKLLPTTLAHSRSNTMSSHLICTSSNEHSNAMK